LTWPSPVTRGMMPTLSGGISLGSSTFMSSSSCTGGLPDRRQILLTYISTCLTDDCGMIYALFVQQVGNPEDSFTLFHLNRIQVER
jgi:hypothetical protein